MNTVSRKMQRKMKDLSRQVKGKLKGGPTCRFRQESGSGRPECKLLLKQKLIAKQKPRTTNENKFEVQKPK